MSASFVGASTQYLQNSASSLVSTGYPFTVGGWVNLSAVGAVARTIFSLSDTGTTNNYLLVQMTSSEQIQVTAAAGGTENSAIATGVTLVAGKWVFFLGRFISSGSRRITVLGQNGNISNNSTVTTRAPTGLDSLIIGANVTSGGAATPWDGLIGEIWYTNTDVQADGAVSKSDLIWQLAYGGPFSVPHIAKDIVEYRSLRSDAIGGETDEVYVGAGKPFQKWVNVNGVTVGQHPSLLYEGIERQSIRPYSLRPLWAGMVTSGGGVDVSEPRAGTSVGVSVVTGRIAVLTETTASAIGTAVDTGRVAIQDAKTGSSIGIAVVNGVINAVVTAERTGTSIGASVVDGRIAVQDAKRSDVTGIGVVTGASTFVTAPISVPVTGTSVGVSVVDGRIAVQDAKTGASVGTSVIDGRIAVQDAKKSDVVGATVVNGASAFSYASERSGSSVGATVVTGRIEALDAKKSDITAATVVTGVSTSESSGNEQRVAGTSVGASIVEARIAWMAEIMGQIQGVTIVDGIATFVDDSAGTGTAVNFNPLIASVGKLMNR